MLNSLDFPKCITLIILGAVFLFSCSSDDPLPITKGVVLNNYGLVIEMSLEENGDIVLAASGGVYRLSNSGKLIWVNESNNGVRAATTLDNSDVIIVERIFDSSQFDTWEVSRISFSTGEIEWSTEIVSESDTSALKVPALFITEDDQILLVSALYQNLPDKDSHLHMVTFDLNGQQLGSGTLMELENTVSYSVRDILLEDPDNLIVYGMNTFETEPIILQKYSNQNHIWTSQFGEQVFFEITKIKKLNGNYVLVGTRQTTASLMVVNESGNLIAESYTGDGQFKHWFYDIILNSQGNYVACGFNNNNAAVDEDAWVVTLDQDGEVLKEQIFGGDTGDRFTVILEMNNRYIGAGWQITDNGGFFDLNTWLLKFDH